MENTTGIIEIGLVQFSLFYVLLIIVGIVLKHCKVNQLKMLVVASLRMTVQLIITGYILTYIFGEPNPLFAITYLIIMIGFAIHRVFSKNKTINPRFKATIALSITVSGICVLSYFLVTVVALRDGGKFADIFNPQYLVPIGGMIMGNTMTGVTLAVKTFRESLDGKRAKIEALTNIGAKPSVILMPFVRQALESAMLPTLNSMLGMGIVALPGMMTGQILSGTLPTTAILYQIAIMISVCTVVTLASFGSLYFGHKTLYNNKEQIIHLD